MAKIALQMWTLREVLPDEGLEAVLEKVSRIGYQGIETVGFYERSPEALRELIADNGLELCSAHLKLPGAEDADSVFEALARLGAPGLFPSLGRDVFVDEVAIGAGAQRFNDVVDTAERHGIELGYHNHEWEFSRLSNSKLGYEQFAQVLDPRVTFEVDTYWVQSGGADAAALVSSLGDRVHYLHIKDGPVSPDHSVPHTALGKGKMDFDPILQANDAVKWHIVELDRCATPIWPAVEESYRFLAEATESDRAQEEAR